MAVTLEDNLNKLNRFRGYKQDWNGYDAPPFEPQLVDEAERIVKGLADLPQPFISPYPEGIQLEWHREDDVYLEIDLELPLTTRHVAFFTCWLGKTNQGTTLEGSVAREQIHINSLIRALFVKKHTSP